MFFSWRAEIVQHFFVDILLLAMQSCNKLFKHLNVRYHFIMIMIKCFGFLDSNGDQIEVKLPGLTPPVSAESEGFDLENMPKGINRII